MLLVETYWPVCEVVTKLPVALAKAKYPDCILDPAIAALAETSESVNCEAGLCMIPLMTLTKPEPPIDGKVV